MQNETACVNKVVGYCRVACHDQVALDMQRDTLLEYAAKKGYVLVDTICEAASGTSSDRAGLQRIKDMVRQRKADRVLALSVSRVGRNTVDVLGFARWLQQSGAAMEFIKEGISTDSPAFDKLTDLI